MAGYWKRQTHSNNLSVLLYIAHVLPLACKSDVLMRYIFHAGDPRNFHADFILNRWNDHIIQPARDAVLDYYKVRTLYPPMQCLRLHLYNQTLFIL